MLKFNIQEEAAFIEEMITEYVETLDEGNIIDIVIDHMNDTLNESDRFEVYNALDKTRSRDHGNWYWIIRRIRNTGALSRLKE
tara:strand:+ start:88 stop:336 length:249 start_codon:yes stop_codon:yes gene_type:complete